MTQKLFYTKAVYSNKVLVGDWFISRLNEIPETKGTQDFSTVYSKSFTPKTISKTKSDKTKPWDHRLNSEESRIAALEIGIYDDPNDFGNFSSTYDLSFNHFPKCYKGVVPRKLSFKQGCYVPMEEYLPTYGNITSYGISEYKKRKWEDELTYNNKCSTYREQFSIPQPEDYNFKRYPKQNSSRLDELNFTFVDTKLTPRTAYSVPQKEMLLGRRTKYCNPITWECTPDMVMKTAK